MPPLKALPAAVLSLALLAGGAGGLQAQALEAGYGAWKPDSLAPLWSVAYRQHLIGPFDYSLGLTHVDDRRSPVNRTATGGVLSLGVGRDGSGVYGVGSVGLGMKHDDGNLDAWWSAGLGWAVRLLPGLSVGVEGTYRTEDQFARGFWRLDPGDRRGAAIQARVALRLPGSSRPRARPGAVPSSGDIERAARGRGVSRAGSRTAADIVSTALEVMGTPYRWGGGDDNGYDCSGLIQYAYGEHGIILPRISREQARLGIPVDRSVRALHPGDILGFAVEGDRVTHVGLYVGDGQFIHSASAGVKLSSLTGTDPDSAWWRRRWIAARRVLQ